MQCAQASIANKLGLKSLPFLEDGEKTRHRRSPLVKMNDCAPTSASESASFSAFRFFKLQFAVEVGSGGVGWGWGSTLTHNYGGLRRGGGNPATQQLVSN